MSNPIRRLIKQKGYSLVETIMMLGIMSMVVVPALMIMDRQAEYLNQFNQLDYNDIYANTLFNNVDLNHPRAVDFFDQSSRVSVFCDPAGKIQPASAFAVSQTCNTGGADATTAPYFTRTVSYVTPPQSSNGTRAIQVNVQLFEDSVAGTAFYDETRQYDIEAYRISFGENYNAAAISLPLVSTDLGLVAEIQSDSLGRDWMPSFESSVDVSGSRTPENYLYYTYKNTCTAAVDNNVGGSILPNEAPFDRHVRISTCAPAQGYESRFRVLNNTYYQVTIYFLGYHQATDATISSCVNNTDGISCALANVVINELRQAAAGTPLYDKETKMVQETVYDLSAAVNDQFDRGFTKTYLVKTSADTDYLEVDVQPASSGVTGSPHTNLAGIEVIRRLDLNE